MAYDHFRPPEHFSRMGRYLFRALCLVTVVVVMAVFAYFVGPLIDRYVGFPLGDFVYEQVRQWTGEPPRIPRT